MPSPITSSPVFPFPVPLEINQKIVSYLSPRTQAQFRRVSRGAKEIVRQSFFKPKFGGVFDSLEKLELFFNDAITKRPAPGRSERSLITLLEKLLSGCTDKQFDQMLRVAGVLPYDLSLTTVQRDWLKIFPNLLGVLRWVSAEGICAIIHAPSPLGERLKNALTASDPPVESIELSLAMVKDETGIDLGITEHCVYLHYVAQLDRRGPNNPQQILKITMGIEIAKILLERGVNIEALSSLSETALHRASQNGYHQLVAFLISKGANIEARDRLGQTPLRMAAESGSVEVVKHLLAAGADPNISPPPHRLLPYITDTPLDTARRHGYSEIIKLLEEAGGLSREDLAAKRNARRQVRFHDPLLRG